MPFVVTSCAFKIHRASRRGRGKPVLICILAPQADQKQRHDAHSRDREFDIGETVLARNPREGPKWITGTIFERTGPSQRVVWRHHTDQLLSSQLSPTDDNEDEPLSTNTEPLVVDPPAGESPVPPPVRPTVATDQSQQNPRLHKTHQL